MGQMRFYAPAPEELLPRAIESAYMAGLEAIPWRSHNHWSDGVLNIDRVVTESGNLYIPWEVPGHGHRVLSTCTLMERDAPYCLATELARGTLHRARSMAADMDNHGLTVPEDIRRRLKEGMASLIRATTVPECVDTAAAVTIGIASNAIDLLCSQFARWAISERRRQEGRLSTLMAGRLGDSTVSQDAASFFRRAFHAASMPFRWKDLAPSDSKAEWSHAEQQLNWCRNQGFRVLGGPLIQLDRLSLPDWVYPLANDYEKFESAALNFIQATVERFDDQVDIWVCSGRLNVGGSLAFTEEQKLRLAVASIEAVRAATVRTPVIISFDQPWAEYLAFEDYDLSPLHFADALVRAELGVAGVGLEINLGYSPHGTLPRDMMEISRHLDRWSLLGIPLIVYLTVPSDVEVDPHAIGPSEVALRHRSPPKQAAINQDAVSELVPLLIANPALHAIVWNQLSDTDPHEFPHSGLFDAAGHAKPILESLAAVREEHLS